MNNSKKQDLSFSVWYFITAIAYLVLSQFDFGKYFIWIKPLPVLFMLMHVHSVSQNKIDVKFIEMGLLFGMIGDILLQIKGSHIYFLLGAGSFFVGHVCYILGFSKGAVRIMNVAKIKGRNHLIWIYIIVIFGLSAYNIYDCWQQLDDNQKIAMPIYMAGLSLMTSAAIGMAAIKVQGWQQTVGVTIFVGSFLFYISDSALAQQKFDKDFTGELKTIAKYTVGITYWLGQFLIAQGAYKLSEIEQIQIKRDTLLTQSNIQQTIEQQK